MFDCHYDLLTYIYMNRFDVEKIKRHCREIYHKLNITGGIFNLFFMSYQEMKEELGIEEKEVNLISMLLTVDKLIQKYKLIPETTQYVYGIEGLDYLEKIEDIEVLKRLGVRSINPVWNNENCFGGGIRSEIGLTSLGEELIDVLVEEKIAIDLSHSNEKTFMDIIQRCKRLKSRGKEPVILASHSNCRAVCDVNRNLTDRQIKEIVDLDGLIGLVGYKRFCIDVEDKEIQNKKYHFEQAYIENIKHMKKLIGNIEHVAVATDDMYYYKIQKEFYQNSNVFPLKEVGARLRKKLEEEKFSQEEIEKLLNLNVKEKLLNKIG